MMTRYVPSVLLGPGMMVFSLILLVALPAVAQKKEKVKSLADLNCTTDQIAKFNGTDWVCAQDNTGGSGGALSCRQVENTIAANPRSPVVAEVSVQCDPGERETGGGCENQVITQIPPEGSVFQRSGLVLSSRPDEVTIEDEIVQGWHCVMQMFPAIAGFDDQIPPTVNATAHAVCCVVAQ